MNIQGLTALKFTFEVFRKMKKRVLKIMCVMLAFVLVFAQSSIAFAKNKVTPVILVHGVGSNPVYENVFTENESEIKTLGLGEITDLLTADNVLSEAVKLLTDYQNCDFNALCTALGNYVQGNPFNLDKDGNPLAGQGVNNYWETPMSMHKDFWKSADISERGLIRQICKVNGSKNVYAFNYDWRVDARQSAKQLNKMIKAVKKRTGAKKVALVGCSFGGAVLSAYMDAYKKQNDVTRYLFVNPAINGVDVTRMYAGDIKITKKGVLKYLNGMQGANPGSTQETIMKVVKAVGDVRVAVAAENFAKISKSEKNKRILVQKVIKPWFGNVVGLWECIPYDVFNSAVKYCSSVGMLDKNSGVYKKIKAYHKVQGHFRKNVKYVKKHGAQVAIVANYGEPGIPVTSKANNHIDGLIDTKRASGGAIVANYGKKLKGKNAKGKYVSPDKVINAKTCVTPNSTWFIKDIQHMQFRIGTKATKFIANLACGKVKYNIKAVKKKYKYSQFIQADKDQNLSNV